MSVCIEQRDLKNNINQFSQNLCVNEQPLAYPQSHMPKRGLLEQVNYWIAISRQRKELARLDESLLADIGFTAEQAREEYSKPFWK